MTKLNHFFALFVLTISFKSQAVIPDYAKPEILARANGPDYYNLPPMSFLNSTTATINNNGDVAFKLMAVEGQAVQGLWVNGQVVYRAPEDKVMTDPVINDDGKVVFSIFEEFSSEGVFVYDLKTSAVDHVLKNQSKDIIAFGYLQMLTGGEIFFRATHPGQDHSFFEFSGGLKKVFSEGEDTLGFKPSYLFGPMVNNQRQMASKIRLGNKMDWADTFPDQILLMNADHTHRIIAEDQKTNSLSPYKGFANSVSLSENGLVAFVGVLKDGKKTLVVDNQGTQTRFATEGLDDISEMELFAPQVNAQGLLVFRAKNNKGQRGIYLADGQSVHRVIGENDEIPTDMGMGRVFSNPNIPAFGGNVRINDRNEIVFYVLLKSAIGNHDWGSGIYKIKPQPSFSAPSL